MIWPGEGARKTGQLEVLLNLAAYLAYRRLIYFSSETIYASRVELLPETFSIGVDVG